MDTITRSRRPETLRLLTACLMFGMLLACLPSRAEVTDIDSDQLMALMEHDAVVIDVRLVEEWKKTGIIEDTHLLTFFDKYGGFDAIKWLADISEFADADKPVVLICHAGVRSLWIANWMDQNTKYNQIYNHPGGISSWMQQGRPLVKY